jgi:hypothetical protein
MAVVKDGRRIFSLTSFLISLPLAVLCGYLTFAGGFFSGTGDLLLIFYALAMAICGGFALSSCLHLLMVPKGAPQNVTDPKGNPSSNQIHATKSNPAINPIKQKPATNNPGPNVPVIQSILAKAAAPVPQVASPETQAVQLIGPVAKNNLQFLQTFMKLATIAKECEELVENERDLSKKEQVRLSLRRREFRQVYSTVKNSRFETF